MTTELPKAYDPKSVEKEIYDRWNAAGAFNAEPDAAGEKFCIVIPPPNVTAALHLGHALNNTLQDVLVRWRRMQGYNALWMPGTDHAGIATQTVVDKRMLAEGEGGLAKYRDLEAQGQGGREQFVAKVQAWKDEYEATILNQLKLMGCSCDWRRTRFTMDEVCAKAVRAAFFKLFSDGLIYRGKRLVNWDPATQTVLADDEVEHEEVKGHFWYLRYPLVPRGEGILPLRPEGVPPSASSPVSTSSSSSSSVGEKKKQQEEAEETRGQDAHGTQGRDALATTEFVTVATTRPETMLGDTAVAMNPRDSRAAALIGRKVRLPIVGREIPIIADEHVVLPDPSSEDEKARFSTGFLKVTPAHDPEDYAIRERCVARGEPIDIINVLAPDGTISEKFGWGDWDKVSKIEGGSDNADLRALIGLDRFKARKKIEQWFDEKGLLEKKVDYVHQVGHSYRSHVPIEPYLSDQWYVAVKKPIPNCELRISDFGLETSDSESKGRTRERPGHFSDPGPGNLAQTLPDHLSDRAAGSNRPAGEGASPTGVSANEPVQFIEGTDVPENSLAGLALKPLLEGRIKFVPDRYANNYRTWLENLRDWPISRQLWWGHRIPVWSKRCAADDLTTFHQLDQVLPDILEDLLHERKGEKSFLNIVDVETGDLLWPTVTEFNHGLGREVIIYVAIREFNLKGYVPDLPGALDRCGFVRDPDVLDTWFSSALWPFSTLGWPDATPELATFYPGDVLCTAREIITLWVSRMVMMGQYCRGDIPFHDVFIHAMIQDGEGRKMSKSLGNGIDPLEIIDSHGADAMRFTLVSMTTQTQDVRLPVQKMKLPDGREVNSSPKFDVGRNFCNKLWNASRFAMMNLRPCPPWGEVRVSTNLPDRWILSRLNATIRDATAALEEYRFNELGDTLYHFMWDDFCDWYLEIAKGRINSGEGQPRAIVAHCLDVILRLLHPIAPFITEAIWANLNQVAPARGPAVEQAEPMLIRAAWPRADARAIDPNAEADFTAIQDLIRQVRNVRTQHNVPPSKRLQVQAHVEAGQERLAALIRENADLFTSQANLETLDVTVAGQDQGVPPADAAAIAVSGVKLYVLGAVDKGAELTRLTKQRDTLAKGIGAIEAKLASAGFVAKAPPAVVEKERKRLEGLQAEMSAVENSLAARKS